jgi:hypothetical protein
MREKPAESFRVKSHTSTEKEKGRKMELTKPSYVRLLSLTYQGHA